jgi:hypothetical protein
MTEFLALYSGQTVNSSEVIAVSADPLIVRDFTERLLAFPHQPITDERERNGALKVLEGGRMKASSP